MPTKHDVVAVDLNGTALFDPEIPVGHSLITKAKDAEQPDKGWSAAMSAAKAAHWFATRFDDTGHTECHIAFPVVVTDAVLATAKLDGGQIHVSEVDHARFVLKWPLGDTHAVIVDVVRASALAGFVEGCALAADLLLRHTKWASGAS
jgi:hypothetical protein